MNTRYPDIALLILCGGQSRRMHGEDKGLIQVNGKPLISHTVDALSEKFAQIYISANRHLATYRALGFEVLTDTQTDSGPLAGIHAGLRVCSQTLLLVSPCDTPCISSAIAERLIQAATDDDTKDVYIAYDGERAQYLHVLLDNSQNKLFESLGYFLEKDKAVKNWYKTLNSQHVDCSGLTRQFDNINTPEDLIGMQPVKHR